MKKTLYLFAVAALFAACGESDSFKEINTQENNVIGFKSFTGKQTRAEQSENSSSQTTPTNLEAHHESFVVWGYKTAYNADATLRYERVFNKQQVLWDEATLTPNDWDYTPHGFWDKQAAGYRFHAAAPAIDVNNSDAEMGWTITDGGDTYAHSEAATAYKISLPSFTVDGEGLDIANEASLPATVTAKAVMPNNKDIMISNDITGYNNYSAEAVHLHFMHILSRLNIGVKKSATLNDYVVRLKSIKVFNMKSNGQFNEGDVTDAAVLQAGTPDRWSDVASPATTSTFNNGVGFVAQTNGGAELTASFGYVYEALVIPQYVDYQMIDVNGQARTNVRPYYSVDEYNYVNGTNISAANYADDDWCTTNNIDKNKPAVEAASAPYIIIDYTITSKVAGSTTEEFVAYYNLAAAFGKNLSTATGEAPSQVNHVAFNEGWMNTLNITIEPVAISFDADVYEWAETTPSGNQTID